MNNIPYAFEGFRCAYRGAKESVNDIDVDPHGGCLYAACSSGDVCVWDVDSQKMRARLRHSQWVNAVRCFPLCNSAASGAVAAPAPTQLPQPPPESTTAAASPTGTNTAQLCADIVIHHDIRWALAGCEDGVVAVWCPVTYRMQSTCKLGDIAITALQLLPDPEPGSTSGLDDGPAICCAASLRDVYVLRVSVTSSELQLLRALKHQTDVTAFTYVAPSASQLAPQLVVGQEEGTLCVWNCQTWTYADSMPYPANELDVAADACRSPTLMHEPVYELGRLQKTFRYNRRRCNCASDQAAIDEEEAAAVAAAAKGGAATALEYNREVAAGVTVGALDLVELHCGAAAHGLRQAWLQQHQNGGGAVARPEAWRYDARRVTCLAASVSFVGGASAHSYLYSGHATGEVLLWGSLRQDVPLLLLLKKLILFKPGTWVWHLCAVPTLQTSFAQAPPSQNAAAGARGGGRGIGKSPKSRLGRAGKGAAAAAADSGSPLSVYSPGRGPGSSQATTHVSPLDLIVWSDAGSVEYVSARKRTVLHRAGPGFVSSAACSWTGPTIVASSPAQSSLASPSTRGTASPASAASPAASSPAQSPRLRGAARKAPQHVFSAHQYLMMAGFDGRIERYDVTQVLGLVKSSGKVS